MKRIKKIFAFALAMVMMLAMNVTVFADTNTATITIENAGDDAKFTYAQVLVADTRTSTGWAFVSPQYEQDFKSALFPVNEETSKQEKEEIAAINDQKVIKAFIEAEASKRAAALRNITTTQEFTNGQEVSTAGLYVINAFEEGYSYETMAAYVGFDYENGAVIALKNAVLNAKKQDTKIEKTSNEEDDVVEVGKQVTYTISTTIPYISEAAEDKTYTLTDTLTGASYDVNENNKIVLNVSVANEAQDPILVDPIYNEEENNYSFVVDLTSLTTGNLNANKTLVITYTATVTDVIVNNTVIPTISGHEFDPATDVLYTGTVTLTKTNVEDEVLEGAKFVLHKIDGKYAVVENGKVTSWVERDKDATVLVTDSNGKIVVSGLDDSASYEFIEVEAPEGYSVNTTPADVNWATEGDGTKAESRTATASMVDTKLSTLPSTGGIGTTIFTIAGVAIMVLAAGLFFVSRRKNAR